ncbi:unnamed protein product, partial [Lymnaea stagnalis]
MVLVTTLAAMHNSRPRIAEQSLASNGIHQIPSKPDRGQDDQYQVGPNDRTRLTNGYRHVSPALAAPGGPGVAGGSPFDHVIKTRQSSLASASMSALPTQRSQPEVVMVNGFIVHSKPTHHHSRSRRVGHSQNGYIVEALDVNGKDFHPSTNGLKSFSCSQISQDRISRNPSSNILSSSSSSYLATASTGGGDHDKPLHHGSFIDHSFSHLDGARSGLARVQQSKSVPNGLKELCASSPADRDPANSGSEPQGSPGEGYPSMSSIDTWSPNYVQMSFFLKNRDATAAQQRQEPNQTLVDAARLDRTNATSGHRFLDKRVVGNNIGGRDRSDDTRRFGSMQCLHAASETFKTTTLKSASSNCFRDSSSRPMTAHHSGRSSTGTNDYMESRAIPHATMPRRGSDQQLRRTVSYEQRGLEAKPSVMRTSSDGEVESEYVTLDHRYAPIMTASRLCRVTEGAVPPLDLTPPHPVLPARSPLTPHPTMPTSVATNHGAVSPDVAMHSPTNSLIRPSRSMQSLKTNPTPDSRVSLQHKRRANNPGTLRVVAETIGSVFYSPRSSGSSSRGSGSPRSISSLGGTPTFYPGGIATSSFRGGGVASRDKAGLPSRMTRSKSLPDLQVPDNEMSSNYSDDEDGDDFGFLSYPVSFTSTAMNKVKSPSPGTRILPKRW